jgi:hypothetical protein
MSDNDTMAYVLIFGRFVCKCEKCAHVWMVDKSRGLPVRCGNAQKRCSAWDGGEVALAHTDGLKPIVARNPLPEDVAEPAYVRDEYSQD